MSRRANDEIEFQELTPVHTKIAKYLFAHPKVTNVDLAKKFYVSTSNIWSILKSKPFKQQMTVWEERKTENMVEKMAQFEVDGVIRGVKGGKILDDILAKKIAAVTDDKGKVLNAVAIAALERSKIKISSDAVEQTNKYIAERAKTAKPDSESGTININNMQVNIADMSMKQLHEFVMTEAQKEVT